MAPAICVPMKLYALILVTILVLSLVALMTIWLGEKEPAPKIRQIRRKAAAAALGLAIIPLSIVAAVFDCPSTATCLVCGTSLKMRVVNSSSDFTMDDFGITVNYSWDRYLNIERQTGYSYIEGMDYGSVYTIGLTCNRTPIFWGNNNLTMKAYVSHSFFILAYTNSTGGIDMFTIEPGSWHDSTHVYHFGFGSEWVDIQVDIYEVVD